MYARVLWMGQRLLWLEPGEEQAERRERTRGMYGAWWITEDVWIFILSTKFWRA